MRNYFFKSEFSKNVLVLLTGTTIAQVIPIAITPLLTRLFTPEEFGILAFYASIITFLSIIGTGRYELSILLPKKNKDGLNLLALSFIILTTVSLLLLLICFSFFDNIIAHPKFALIGNWLFCIPPSVFLLGGVNILTAWNNRNKRFKETSLSKVGMYTGDGLSSLLIGIPKNNLPLSFDGLRSILKPERTVLSANGWGSQGLFLSKFIGICISFCYLAFQFAKQRNPLRSSITKSNIKDLMVEYRDFPRINLLHAITDELKTSGLTFVILYFFLEKTLGIYNMTYKLLRAPLAIIGNSFGQVFFQKAAQMTASGESIVGLIRSTVKKLLLIGLPIFTLVFILSPFLFELLLGEEWKTAGYYARYLTPWLFVNFVISPISQVAIILKQQFKFWMINLFSNVLIFSSIVFTGIFFHEIEIGFIIISVSQVLFYIWVYFWILKISINATKPTS